MVKVIKKRDYCKEDQFFKASCVCGAEFLFNESDMDTLLVKNIFYLKLIGCPECNQIISGNSYRIKPISIDEYLNSDSIK